MKKLETKKQIRSQIKQTGFSSTKVNIRSSIKKVPRKHREAVKNIIKTNEYK